MGDYAGELIESAVYLLFTYEKYIRNWPREGYFSQLTELVSSCNTEKKLAYKNLKFENLLG